MVPDGLEPSFSGCKPGVVAAGPRDQIESGLTGTRTRPAQIEWGWHATPASSCWTMSPSCKAEAVGLEPTTVFTAPVFKTGPSSSRVTSNSCGGRTRTCGPVVQSNGFLPTETTPHRAKGRAGLEPARRCLTGTCSAAELPTRIRVPCGTRTHNGLFVRTCSRGRLLNQSDDFHFYQAAVAGIEPASRRLTVAFPYQHRTHRITSVSVVGFEPTISCSQGTRIPKLSHTLNLS